MEKKIKAKKMGREKSHGLTAQKVRELFKAKKHKDGRYDLLFVPTTTLVIRNSLLIGPNNFKVNNSWYKTARLVYIFWYGEIPDGDCVKFADEDISNFDPKNLVCTSKRHNKTKEEEMVNPEIGAFFAEIDAEEEEMEKAMVEKVEGKKVKRNSLEIVHNASPRDPLKLGDIFSFDGETFLVCDDGFAASLSTGNMIDLRDLFGLDESEDFIYCKYTIHKNPKLILERP